MKNFIKGVKLAALIEETALGWTCSMNRRRSFQVRLYSEDGVNAANIAARFGGSGSAKSAIFHITTTLPKLKDRIAGLSDSLSDSDVPGGRDLSPSLDIYPNSSEEPQDCSF